MTKMPHWLKQLQLFHKVFLGTGLIAALVFGYNYLIAAQGDCGVVRFYEYTFGFLGIVVWGGGNLAALFLIVKPKRKNVFYKAGTALLAVINSLIICITFFLLYSFMDDAFIFTSTRTLIERVENEDDRLAVLELGRRNVKDTIPLLCRIALDQDKDINLRLNTSYALRKIGSHLPRDTEYYKAMFTCLLQMLTDEQQHLRSSAAETFGIINDTSAVTALLKALEKEDNVYVKSDIVQTLGLLGDNRAFQPLSVLLADKGNSHFFQYKIKEALEKLKATENGNSDD
jgi:HEAT repeat protein